MTWWMNLSRGTKTAIVVGATVALVGCCLVASVYSTLNNWRGTTIRQEKQLTAQYLSNQNELSAYISGFYEQISVTQAAKEGLNEILEDAVKGRYDEDGYGVGSPMYAAFTAIAEAYPEAGVAELMANWGKIQDYISAGRESYKAKQDKLLDILRIYDTWRAENWIRGAVLSALGFPSDHLEARIGEMVYTGEMARNKMYQIVLTSEAIKAYETGIMEPLEVPQSE